MKSTCLPYLAFICAAMSTTGPQTRDWQSCGVANSSATGFLPTTSANESPCMSSGGCRVSIDATSPLADASVSVCTCGGCSPTSGIGSAARLDTCTCVGAATSLPFTVVATSTEYAPGLRNGTCAA